MLADAVRQQSKNHKRGTCFGEIVFGFSYTIFINYYEFVIKLNIDMKTITHEN